MSGFRIFRRVRTKLGTEREFPDPVVYPTRGLAEVAVERLGWAGCDVRPVAEAPTQ